MAKMNASYHRAWRLKNPEKRKAKDKKYRELHKEKIKHRSLLYRQKNRKLLVKKAIEYIKRNPMKGWRYSKEYYLRHRKEIVMRKRKWYKKISIG
jgi:hypothetical protein